MLDRMQLFAEEEKPAEQEEQKQEEQKKEEPEKKYTDADVDKIINRKFAEFQKKFEKERAEAEKLAQMNAEQKANFEKEKVEQELADLKRQVALNDMTKEARKILLESGVSVPDSLLSVLVSEDAESTKTRIEDFSNIYKQVIADGVKEALKGNEPKAGGSQAVLTREDIEKVKDRAERQRLMAEHADLFTKGN